MPGEQETNELEPGPVRPGALSALLQDLARAPAAPSGEGDERALRPGVVVGRFELLREVGRGGFGVVFEARDRELGRAVAFKVLRSGPGHRAQDELLLREAEAAARLSHPNIVTLHDVGRGDCGPYLVMELLRGETLATRLSKGALPVPEALRVAVEVTKGLAHAHAHGVVHRDLTPGNVFLCDDGQVKVLDLGMAHAFGRRRLDGGTPAYMAPEQRRGAPEDERTDVFALGVILYRMLSGELPFPDDAALDDPTPAPALEVSAASGLGGLVGRLLEKDPVRRPRDGGEVLAALAELERSPSDGSPMIAPSPRRPDARVGGRSAILAGPGPAQPSAVLEQRTGARAMPGARRALVLAALGLLVVAPLLAWYVLRARGTAPVAETAGATRPSIAVLPFVDMSAEHDQEYFSDGIAEEILNALARVDGLRVTGRTSSFSFKGKSAKIGDIGRELGVRTVLEGSVRKSGSRLRITAQLVSVEDGYHLWSDTYDRELSDVFAVQSEIARAVVTALRPKLLHGRGPGPEAYRTGNVEAYNQYLLGKQLLQRADPASAQRAVDAFERARSLDRAHGPSFAGLSRALLARAWFAVDWKIWADARREAGEAAEEAVRLAPALPDGYVARANVRLQDWDWRGAQADLERAEAADPGGAGVLGVRLSRDLNLGRLSEAAEAARRLTELDPLNARAWNSLGLVHDFAEDRRGARESYLRALEIDPESTIAALNLLALDVREGQFQTALDRCERLRERAKGAIRRGIEAFCLVRAVKAHHALGHARQSDEALARLVALEHVPALWIAEAHASRGDADQAFAWLERAVGEHDQYAAAIKARPGLRALRGDPRYGALLRRMNLPPD